jgi:hypothetical protein
LSQADFHSSLAVPTLELSGVPESHFAVK